MSSSDGDCTGGAAAVGPGTRTLRHVRSGTLKFADSTLTSHVEHDVIETTERPADASRTSHRVVGSDGDLRAAGELAERSAEAVAETSRAAVQERAALWDTLASLGPGLYGRIEDTYGATATVDETGRTAVGTMARRGAIITTVRHGVRRTRAVAGPRGEIGGKEIEELVLAGVALPEYQGPLPTQVVLEPLALAELLAEYASVGLAVQEPADADEFHRRWVGRQVAAPGVDLTDDPTGLGGWTIDAEGTLSLPLPLIHDGRVVGYATDHLGGATLGTRSNGRASWAVDGLTAYPSALHLTCPPAEPPAGRWLRIERTQYISVVAAHTGTVTGSTRDYCTVVEDGVPIAVVQSLRFTLGVPDLLRRITGGLGSARTVPVTWGGCVVRSPAVHCADLTLLP